MSRLAAGVAVSALIRRAAAEGGTGMVLAKGNAEAGAILVVAVDRGANPRLFERGIGPGGLPALIRSGPQEDADDAAITAYWQRRRTSDPDLWVVELDIPTAERLIVETILGG